MKNNKGFVFIETMVTIVILATALLSLYTLFNNMLIKEKRRVYYDDPTYIYRSYYLFEVFKSCLYKLIFGVLPWETKLAGLTAQEQAQAIFEKRKALMELFSLFPEYEKKYFMLGRNLYNRIFF